MMRLIPFRIPGTAKGYLEGDTRGEVHVRGRRLGWTIKNMQRQEGLLDSKHTKDAVPRVFFV